MPAAPIFSKLYRITPYTKLKKFMQKNWNRIGKIFLLLPWKQKRGVFLEIWLFVSKLCQTLYNWFTWWIELFTNFIMATVAMVTDFWGPKKKGGVCQFCYFISRILSNFMSWSCICTSFFFSSASRTWGKGYVRGTPAQIFF